MGYQFSYEIKDIATHPTVNRDKVTCTSSKSSSQIEFLVWVAGGKFCDMLRETRFTLLYYLWQNYQFYLSATFLIVTVLKY